MFLAAFAAIARPLGLNPAPASDCQSWRDFPRPVPARIGSVPDDLARDRAPGGLPGPPGFRAAKPNALCGFPARASRKKTAAAPGPADFRWPRSDCVDTSAQSRDVADWPSGDGTTLQPAAQVIGHCRSGTVAVTGFIVQTLQADRLQVSINRPRARFADAPAIAATPARGSLRGSLRETAGGRSAARRRSHPGCRYRPPS